MDPSDEIHFDGWTLRRRTGELLKASTRVRLQSQPLGVLEELLAHPGELVTREQLIARLWPQGVVDFDTALNSAVHRLRTALDDPAERPRYIETIPRRGYRFVGLLDTPAAMPPEPVPVVPPSPPNLPRWYVVIPALLLFVGAVAALLMFGAKQETSEQNAPRSATSPEAMETYLRAQHFFQRRSTGDLEHARRYYEEALAINPDFAEAWVGLASVFWIMTVEDRLPAEQGFAKVRDAAERALALDPHLAEAHVRLSNYRRIVGDNRQADEHMRKALELEPGSGLVLSASASAAAADGRYAEAIELQRRAVEVAPLSQVYRYNLGVYLFNAGRHKEALREMVELSELNPVSEIIPEIHGLVLVVERRFEEALTIARKWPAGADRFYITALANDGLGRRADAETALLALIETGGAAEAFRIAEVYAFRGDADHAFEWLRNGEAYVRETRWRLSGRRPLWILGHSPLLRPLQDDPRWATWYTAARQPWRQAANSQSP